MRYSGNPDDLIIGGVLHRTTIDPATTPLSLGERRRRAKRRRSRSRSRSKKLRLREISGRSFAAGSKERGRRAAETTVKESKMALFGERKRSRRRSRRRSREVVTGLFGAERKRRRSRSRSRRHTKMGRVAGHMRRTREPRLGLFGAVRATERKRRRRSRSRSRSRSRRRSREVRALRVGERRRRRSRSRSRIRSRIRSGAKRALGYSERRRRRSRRRSREATVPMFAVGERRRRRRSRSRSRSRSRRRSRELGMTAFLGERRRHHRGRRRSRVTGRFMDFGIARRNGAFTDEVLKPGAIAAVGLVGTRLLSQQVGKLTASLVPSSPTLAKWVPSGVSALSAYGVWLLSSKVQALRPHRGFLAIGAGLAVVEELLAVILPMVGLTSGQAGLAGMIGNALYGTDQGLGFPCFTGGCPQGVSVPFPNPPCSACPPGVAQVDANGQPLQGLGFPCFTGGCPQGVSVPFPNPPCSACPPGGVPTANVVVTTPNGKVSAAQVAMAQSGFTDPVAQQVLAGLSGRAQEIISGAGM